MSNWLKLLFAIVHQEPKPDRPKRKKKTSEIHFTQILSTLCFVFILVIIGIPLWWKLTEVSRSYFPYNDIDNLNFENISFLLNVYISAKQDTVTKFTNEFPKLCANSSIFRVNVMERLTNNLNAANVSYLESMTHIHPNSSGSILLLEIPSLTAGQIIMSKHRSMYFGLGTGIEKIYSALSNTVFMEEEITEAIATVMSPGSLTNSNNQLRRVRPNVRYDIIFTTVYSEPKTYKFEYDQEKTIKKYFKRFSDQLSSVAEFTLRSHWLFDVDLHVNPVPIKTDTENYHVFTYGQIPKIITPLENRFGSGIAKNPCLHFVLLTSKCSESPTYFADQNGTRSLAALSARWGGIQILNPRERHCLGSNPLKPDDAVVMDIFVKQFRLLFGLTADRFVDVALSTGKTSDDKIVLHQWQLDTLYRLKITEFFISSKLTLLSLSKLLGEISNIVITEAVSESVAEAVHSVQNVLRYSRKGAIDLALNYSKEAFVKSEYAFTHPSLLALLYFPDDQKYAVYIPLYLPVMIPVIMSFGLIVTWIRHWRKNRNFAAPLIKEESSDDEDENVKLD